MHRRHVTIHEKCHCLALSCAAGVQYIIDTVVEQCQMNPDRKFTYVEQAFFHRWWTEQTASTKTAVRALVKSGQLQFINGGWSMHDEACTHYVSMIENTAFGHRFLKDEFDYKPTVGWQIDPFGHSATQVICSGRVECLSIRGTQDVDRLRVGPVRSRRRLCCRQKWGLTRSTSLASTGKRLSFARKSGRWK